mmetsp:Transcript_5003/g.11014  ORF Transcript_5003/g.11014 Transcript_5003/m.11014 type:complete len:187 (-) Transcript_5003:171-731(-)
MADRKSRLAALAAKAGRQQTTNNDGGNDQEDSGSSKPTLSFRNYVPKDASLQPGASSAAPDDDDDGTTRGSQHQLSKRQKTSDRRRDAPASSSSAPQKSALEIALAKTSRESREAAGQNVGAAGGWSKVTPVSTKKVNWDLKRDIQHKMDKLERRTQRAIVELLRERLEREAAEGGGDMDEDSDLD